MLNHLMDPFRVPSLLADFLPAFLESSDLAGAFVRGRGCPLVMFRSPSAKSPLGYLSRQLGLAAIPLKPSAWVAWGQILGKWGGNFKGDHRPGDGNQELPGKKIS